MFELDQIRSQNQVNLSQIEFGLGSGQFGQLRLGKIMPNQGQFGSI